MSTASKAGKKNARKRAKKNEAVIRDKIAASRDEEVISEREDPQKVLKAKLAEAKANGDVKLSAKLRQDLWILQDVNSGVDPALEDKQAVAESLERLANHVPIKVIVDNSKAEAAQQQSTRPPPQQSQQSQSTLPPHFKELKKLKKKLKDIEDIKEKQSSGKVLEDTQIEKITKEESIRKEIHELEESLGLLEI